MDGKKLWITEVSDLCSIKPGISSTNLLPGFLESGLASKG